VGHWLFAACVVAALVVAGDSRAETPALASQPVQQLLAPAVPAPVDHAYAGAIELQVDASDVARKIFQVCVRLPVQQAGPLTLLYPRWESASHGPSLSASSLAGLEISADGKRLHWRRNPVEPHAFHVDVPAGARTVEAVYQVIAGADALAPDMVVLPWQRLVLYPAGWYARNIPVQARVVLPPGLEPASALEVEPAGSGRFTLAGATLETLLDSPLYAARHFARIRLDAPTGIEVDFDLMASRAGDLEIPRAQLAALQRMLDETFEVFGPPPFQRYRFLARMEDDASTGGSEHRSSSEISLPSNYFHNWGAQLNSRDIIPHELVHAWNGIHRIPADLWTPTPNTPQGGSLLWVYEGQSEFWARILAARAGLRSRQETLDQIAFDAARVARRPGRGWRSLADDVNYPSFMLRQPVRWPDWQRRKDYYQEGVLLWLDVDAQLRRLSGGKKGIDDFAHAFFAGAGPGTPSGTYTFEQLCAALDAIAAHDWATHLRAWVEGHDEVDTDTGLARHGWRVVYRDEPTATFTQHEAEEGIADLSSSLGFTVTAQGIIGTVSWEGPAFRAELAPGTRIIEVQGKPFNSVQLLAATRAAEHSPVRLVVEQDGVRTERTIPYHGTLRYPHLERIPGTVDTLSALLAPRR